MKVGSLIFVGFKKNKVPESNDFIDLTDTLYKTFIQITKLTNYHEIGTQ